MSNIANRLTAAAALLPDAVAVVEPHLYDERGKRTYRTVSLQALDEDSGRIAAALCQMGVKPGTRLALLVRPGIDFIALVFGLFKAGAVAILIDPGMGRLKLARCLAEAQPQGFIAIPVAHAVRVLLGRSFPKARLNVTVGKRWFWGGPTLDELRARNCPPTPTAAMADDDPAAIIFTTGSTGPSKGVLYSHQNFNAQVDEIRDFYGIQPGEIDVSCFPLFALFNCAMGATTVIPDMDPSRPAQADPAKIVEAIEDWQATQAFGSPAIWRRVGRYCGDHGARMGTLRRVLSAGAPVSAQILEEMRACIHPQGEMHTPYGATEALPVASIGSREILGETCFRTRHGGGVCVGRRFPGIDWRVIRIVDGPIESLAETESLPAGEIGELIVRGPVVTRQYVTRVEANRLGKIVDGGQIWHRMGDTGYLDERERFWFCGRVAHRVLTAAGAMYTIPCEAILNQHEAVARSALVGIGHPGAQRPALIVEPRAGRMPRSAYASAVLLGELRQLAATSPLTQAVEDFLVHPSFPVDIRHNAKIFREKLAVWAARKLKLKRKAE
jgi:acyl-CoA synthetase (AMP-forming)/AMP-acid ligase II